jgi:hypothetical protein
MLDVQIEHHGQALPVGEPHRPAMHERLEVVPRRLSQHTLPLQKLCCCPCPIVTARTASTGGFQERLTLHLAVEYRSSAAEQETNDEWL